MYHRKPQPANDNKRGCWPYVVANFVIWGSVIAMGIWYMSHARAADLNIILYDNAMRPYEIAQLKRWRAMCKTGARYDAMREAYDKNRPNPC